MQVLDDHCIAADKLDDDDALKGMNLRASIIQHPSFESRSKDGFLNDKTLGLDAFRLAHYAGRVTYSIRGFLDKNADFLHSSIPNFLYGCAHPLLPALFADGAVQGGTTRTPTLGTQFKGALAELTSGLSAKSPHYIRCIKPNKTKKPM